MQAALRATCTRRLSAPLGFRVFGIGMPKIEYNIDFGKILEVALKGVRRATVFLGLGVNAALETV